MSHFTYSKKIEHDKLKQGDILHKNEEIRSMIQAVHPHYLKEDYKFFIVLTQSCDLIKRDGQAPYISLAAVRPFDLLLQRKISNYQKTDIERIGRICSQSKKWIIHQFLERLFNNNEPEYFYLYEDDSFGLSEPMVAFLRLSIAVKTDLHYEKCLNAKFIELDENFTAKLGWLVGNMYSRVGTKDWVPDLLNKEGFYNKCDDVLNKSALWYDEKVIKALRKHEKEVKELTKENIKEMAEEINTSLRKKKDIALDCVKRILLESDLLPENDINKLVMRINNDSVFSTQFK